MGTLLLHEIHNRHDDGRLRQLDPQFVHDWLEVPQELIERFLVSQISNTGSCPSSPKYEWSFIAFSGAPTARRRSPMVCCSAVMFLVTMQMAIKVAHK
jgi:hypothetical protein